MMPLLHVGSLTVRTWSVVVTLAILAAWGLLVRRARGIGLPPVQVLLCAVLAFPVGATGSIVMEHTVKLLVSEPNGNVFANPRTGGMTALGAILSVLLFVTGYARLVFREHPGRLLDAAAFTLPMVEAIGRLGCLLNGCCIGRRAPDSFGPFTIASSQFVSGTLARDLYPDGGGLLWNFPFILTIANILVVVVEEITWRKRYSWRLPHGGVLATTITVAAGLRAAAEPTRQAESWLGTNLSVWLALAAGAALSAAAWLAWRWRGTSPANRWMGAAG